jgi:ABC-type spermidine/putrescine transport system permease subunit II
MYTGLMHLHSTLAIAVILGLLVTILMALFQKPLTDLTRKVAKISMILFHTQFLVGLVMYFVSPRGFYALSIEMLSISSSRLYAIEHPLVAFIALVLITIGHAKMKRANADLGAKPLLIFYSLGLLLVLSRIPWSTWSILQ